MSRRRCCLCFVYEKTDVECRGQIAHIDRNRSNNKFDNLAFLCIPHHDAYDSKTSQSKGWQPEEVKRARQLLYDDFERNKKIIITVDRDFDTLSKESKAEINSIIRNVVGRDVEIKITPGSIKIEVSASAEQAKELLIAARVGMLDKLAGCRRRTVWVAQPQETTSCGSDLPSDVPHHPTRMPRFLVAEATRTRRPGYPFFVHDTTN